jgi:outer membrane protein assembly factor BamB
MSWSTDGQSNLRAINAQDGTTLWTGDFAASQPIQFLFDAQEHVFALDTSEGQDFLARVNTADGTLAWEYRAESPTLDVVLDNSSDYVLVQAANQLAALDKATGKWLWSYDVGSAAADVTSQAHFTALSNPAAPIPIT